MGAATRTVGFYGLGALVAAAAVASNVAFLAYADRNADIYFIFQDGLAIADGRNPYARTPHPQPAARTRSTRRTSRWSTWPRL